jgi:hypothetical protein
MRRNLLICGGFQGGGRAGGTLEEGGALCFERFKI